MDQHSHHTALTIQHPPNEGAPTTPPQWKKLAHPLKKMAYHNLTVTTTWKLFHRRRIPHTLVVIYTYEWAKKTHLTTTHLKGTMTLVPHRVITLVNYWSSSTTSHVNEISSPKNRKLYLYNCNCICMLNSTDH